MAFVDSATAMSHCRADSADADLVALYLDAAEDAALAYLNRAVYATQEDMDAANAGGTDTTDAIVVNPSIKAAILLLTGHLYANRESVIVGADAVEMPAGSRNLLWPYRKMAGM